jgi:hypothetical protein
MRELGESSLPTASRAYLRPASSKTDPLKTKGFLPQLEIEP